MLGFAEALILCMHACRLAHTKVLARPMPASRFAASPYIGEPYSLHCGPGLWCRKEQERDKVWSSRESTAMKRDALLDCLETGRDCYRHAWACTSVDIAIQVQDLIPSS